MPSLRDVAASCLRESRWLAYSLATSVVVILGVVFGHDFLELSGHWLAREGTTLDSFSNWDGHWYATIASRGYLYDPKAPSTVAFFPAFPLLGRGLSWISGLSPEVSLLCVSNLFFLACAAAIPRYLSARNVGENVNSAEFASYVLVVFGLFPTTFFFRMAYSESLFLFCLLILLFGLQRGWPLFTLALIAGATTAVRPVGVAVLFPIAWFIYSQNATRLRKAIQCAWAIPLSCWGLFAYMAFQQAAFGNALAFAQTQSHFRVRPQAPVFDKAVSLLTFEPVWSVYDPESATFWQDGGTHPNAFFGLQYTNSVFFVAALILIVVGMHRRWLTRFEFLLSIPLILIPYVTRGFEMGMASQGRFAAVVFPVYIVLAELLRRMSAPAAGILLALSAVFLFAYSALFAAWYMLI
jgi:hypothetical protein